MAIQPSKDWKEIIPLNEEELLKRLATQLSMLQRVMNKTYGKGRLLHRKQLAACKGTLQISSNVSEHAKFGLFSAPAEYQVLARLSNGGPEIKADRKPDIRGFALKVLGIEGPGALGEDIDSMDLLFINHDTFSHPTAIPFIEMLLSFSQGPFSLLKYSLDNFGLLGSVSMGWKLFQSMTRPFTGFTSELFFTAAPVQCGPYAIKLRLLPYEKPGQAKSSNWGDEFVATLKTRDLCYDLQVQFFVDEEQTPLEDAAVQWSSESSFETVGKLTLPAQDLTDESNKTLFDETESLKFDPWNTLLEHKPLGSIMRARKVVYFNSQKLRKAKS